MNISTVDQHLAPTDLLLSADPSLARVKLYTKTGIVFVGESEGKSVAVAVLNVSGKKAELNNIAVAEDLRGKGLGQQMLKHVLNYARHHGIHRVEVGTGNSSLCQLSFYQRNGFRITGVVPGFFDHYDPVIVENGIPCLDMVRLASQLKED